MNNEEFYIQQLEIEESELLEQLDYWENYIPVNNMGKWSTSERINNIKQRLAKIKTIVETNETIYLYDILDNEKL
jgi:hypothetical protein